MNRQQRKELLTKEITNVLAKLRCVDTERAIVAFNNFIEVTLLDEFGDESSPCNTCVCFSCSDCVDCYGCIQGRTGKNPNCRLINSSK